jgi:hypothetical protein
MYILTLLSVMIQKARPAYLMLSPSDGALKSSAKAVSDILEEADEESGVMSEVGNLCASVMFFLGGLIPWFYRVRLLLRACVSVYSVDKDLRARKPIQLRPHGTQRKGYHQRRHLR